MVFAFPIMCDAEPTEQMVLAVRAYVARKRPSRADTARVLGVDVFVCSCAKCMHIRTHLEEMGQSHRQNDSLL